jgi:hypothetical protein
LVASIDARVDGPIDAIDAIDAIDRSRAPRDRAVSRKRDLRASASRSIARIRALAKAMCVTTPGCRV